MATYRIKRLEGTGEPGAAMVSWLGMFDDEFAANLEARRLAAAETNPAVGEYVVCRVFPKQPPMHLASFPTAS